MNACVVGRSLAGVVWMLFAATALGQIAAQPPARRPSRVEPPFIDAKQAAAAAMKLYDKNKDGLLRDAELDAAPELKAALKTLDRDGDGAISAGEIVGRIEAWKASRVGLMVIVCEVRHRGRPLDGAKVVWEPAAWLGKAMKRGEGTTDAKGHATVAIPKNEFPGMPPGLYRVRITHPKVKLAEQYNTKSVLAVEVAVDSKALETGVALFELELQPQGVDVPSSPVPPR